MKKMMLQVKKKELTHCTVIICGGYYLTFQDKLLSPTTGVEDIYWGAETPTPSAILTLP